MDRGVWQTTVHGVTRVGHNLATKPSPVVQWLRHGTSPAGGGVLTMCVCVVGWRDSEKGGVPGSKPCIQVLLQD